jgi:hypothetical protein
MVCAVVCSSWLDCASRRLASAASASSALTLRMPRRGVPSTGATGGAPQHSATTAPHPTAAMRMALCAGRGRESNHQRRSVVYGGGGVGVCMWVAGRTARTAPPHAGTPPTAPPAAPPPAREGHSCVRRGAGRGAGACLGPRACGHRCAAHSLVDRRVGRRGGRVQHPQPPQQPRRRQRQLRWCLRVPALLSRHGSVIAACPRTTCHVFIAPPAVPVPMPSRHTALIRNPEQAGR